jgi:hypothetical protein
MRIINILFAMLFLSAIASASVYVSDLNTVPVSSFNFSSSDTINQKFYNIQNPTNISENFNISFSGQALGLFQTLSTSYTPQSVFSVNPNSQTGFILQTTSAVNSLTAGTYVGAMTVNSSISNETRTYQIFFIKSKWLSTNSRIYVEQGSQVIIKSGSTVINKVAIKKIMDSLVFFDILTSSGAKIASDQMGVGDGLSDNDEVGVEVLKVGTDTAKLQVYSTESGATFTVDSSSSIGSGGAFITSPSSHNVQILTSEQPKTFTDSITNGFDDIVSITSVSLSPEGSSWIYLGTFATQNLNPNDKLTIPVIIDPSKAPTGQRVVSLNIFGFYKSKPVSTSITYTITISQDESSAMLNGTISEATLSVSSSTIGINQEIEVKVSNVYQTDDLKLKLQGDSAYTTVKGKTIANNVASWTIKFLKAGAYTLYAEGYRQGSLIPFKNNEYSKRVFVGVAGRILHVSLEPSEVKMGLPSKISVLDNENNTVEGATITINGVVASNSSILPTLGNSVFTICASLEPYTPTSPCPVYSVSTGAISIQLDPSFPLDGELVSFKITKPDGVETKLADIFVDGEKQTLQSATLSKGRHLIMAISKEGYESYNTTVDVLKQATKITFAGSFTAMDNLQINLGAEPTNYCVYYSTNEVDTNTEKVICNQNVVTSVFVPEKAGWYTFVSGSVIEKRHIDGTGWLDGTMFGIQKSHLGLALFALIFIGVMIWLLGKLGNKGRSSSLPKRPILTSSSTGSGSSGIREMG